MLTNEGNRTRDRSGSDGSFDHGRHPLHRLTLAVHFYPSLGRGSLRRQRHDPEAFMAVNRM
jgi:hypothetical protein